MLLYCYWATTQIIATAQATDPNELTPFYPCNMFPMQQAASRRWSTRWQNAKLERAKSHILYKYKNT